MHCTSEKKIKEIEEIKIINYKIVTPTVKSI